jgi:hypothetical protein
LFSVVHPDEYEKRLVRFLLDKVFIDSKQTLDELLASPITSVGRRQSSSTIPSINGTDEEYENQNGHSKERCESFEFIQISHIAHGLVNSETIIQTTEVLQNLTIQPITTTDNDKMYTQSTSL